MKRGKGNQLKKLLPIWLLLVAALVIFIAFSLYEAYLPENPWIKTAPFRASLLHDSGSDSLSDVGIPDDMSAVPDSVPVAIGPDSIHKMLLFGDSMTILVANRVAYYGKQNNYDVVSVTWYSSSTKVWGECDTLSFFIREYKPDFIMVTLGANELFIRDIEERQKYVKNLMRQIGDIPFVWIGPPNWKKDTGINDMVEAAVSPSRFFRTDGMKLDRISDHVHPTQKAADLWADSIMRWIPSSRHPIVASFPDSVKNKPKHTVKLLQPPK